VIVDAVLRQGAMLRCKETFECDETIDSRGKGQGTLFPLLIQTEHQANAESPDHREIVAERSWIVCAAQLRKIESDAGGEWNALDAEIEAQGGVAREGPADVHAPVAVGVDDDSDSRQIERQLFVEFDLSEFVGESDEGRPCAKLGADPPVGDLNHQAA